MPWPKGLKRGPTGFKTPGSGRVKGKPGKAPNLREMIQHALHKAGGVEYLIWAAKAEPKAFIGLVGRMMPQEIHADIQTASRIAITVLTGLPGRMAEIEGVKQPKSALLEAKIVENHHVGGGSPGNVDSGTPTKGEETVSGGPPASARYDPFSLEPLPKGGPDGTDGR